MPNGCACAVGQGTSVHLSPWSTAGRLMHPASLSWYCYRDCCRERSDSPGGTGCSYLVCAYTIAEFGSATIAIDTEWRKSGEQ